MSKENLEQFMSKVADSEELQAKIGEEIDAEALIALGAECGCEFTAEELQHSAELSDEELDTVAGGICQIDQAYPLLSCKHCQDQEWAKYSIILQPTPDRTDIKR